MAGGFPAEPECIAAKSEVIRRITPWPVEPPLQLWRCPMGISPEAAALAGIAAQQIGSDGLTPEVRAYRDGMEIYHVRYINLEDGEGNITKSDRTQVGQYEADGRFTWRSASFDAAPDWLAEAVGARRVAVTECVSWHREGGCKREATRYENRPVGGIARGIALRFTDHAGAIHDEFVRY